MRKDFGRRRRIRRVNSTGVSQREPFDQARKEHARINFGVRRLDAAFCFLTRSSNDDAKAALPQKLAGTRNTGARPGSADALVCTFCVAQPKQFKYEIHIRAARSLRTMTSALPAFGARASSETFEAQRDKAVSSHRTSKGTPRLPQLVVAVLSLSFLFQTITTSAQQPTPVTITIDGSHAVNRFVPSHALGGAIDGHDKGVNDLQLTPANIRQMLSAGLKSLAYRLRTELSNDVWHWNPAGSWSDRANQQGYWVSNDSLGAPISLSYGYKLARRGNTIDQANDEGYSRLDDGDAQSFWKSNPYLSREFTGETNAAHPQWIVIEFPTPTAINAMRFLWGELFATQYQIQYGNFDDVSDIALNPPGTWTDFPKGIVRNGHGGEELLRLAQTPVRARWLRVLMTESPAAPAAEGKDIRDQVGFSMREISAGAIDAQGNFHDQIQHAPDRHKQTIIHVSSTDSWHRESDLDKGIEQVGLDRIYQNGLTNGLPMLLPTGLLYDTPENAANEIRYLRARGYKFEQVELGEEPDGQYVTPEDFGALYLQWADAIHRVDASVKLGGPSFQEILPDDSDRAYRLGNSEWLRRFLEYLKRRGRTSDYSFFSFEWYPFDDVCQPVAPQLARAPKLLEASIRELERRGLSKQIPWIISEYGYSAFATRAELTIEGALLNADVVGKFLTLGGNQAFLFGYTPGYVNRDFPCTAGNNMLFSLGDEDRIADRFATYFGARLLTQHWLEPGDKPLEIYSATSDARDASRDQLVTAYAVHRPDGLWSLLLINKDPARSFEAKIAIHKAPQVQASGFARAIDFYQYSSRQYQLGGTADEPHPIRARDPEHKILKSSSLNALRIPLAPYSLTVVRGPISVVQPKTR